MKVKLAKDGMPGTVVRDTIPGWLLIKWDIGWNNHITGQTLWVPMYFIREGLVEIVEDNKEGVSND